MQPSPSNNIELERHNPALRGILETGEYRDANRTYQAIATGLVDGHVRVALTELHAVSPKPRAFAVWWQAIRAVSLTATLTPSIAVVLFGLVAGWQLRPWFALSAFLGVLLLQLAVNLQNDVEDHLRLLDLPGGLGGAGVIQKGWLSAQTVRRVAAACLIGGAALGLPTLIAHPSQMIAIAVIAVVGTAGYSGRPFGFKYVALGDATVFALCGPAIALGMSYAAFGTASLGVWLLGGIFGAAAVGILHVNNMQDVGADRARGAVTVASKLGPSWSKGYLIACYLVVVSLAALLATETPSPWPWLMAAALSLIIAAPLMRKMVGASDLQAPHLALVRVHAAQTHLLIGLVVIAALGAQLAGF